MGYLGDVTNKGITHVLGGDELASNAVNYMLLVCFMGLGIALYRAARQAKKRGAPDALVDFMNDNASYAMSIATHGFSGAGFVQEGFSDVYSDAPGIVSDIVGTDEG